MMTTAIISRLPSLRTRPSAIPAKYSNRPVGVRTRAITMPPKNKAIVASTGLIVSLTSSADSTPVSSSATTPRKAATVRCRRFDANVAIAKEGPRDNSIRASDVGLH